MTHEEKIKHALGVLTYNCLLGMVDSEGNPQGVHLPNFEAVKYAFETLEESGDTNLRRALIQFQTRR